MNIQYPKLTYNINDIFNQENMMSNEINDQYLEHKYEEGLAMGMSEEEAANYARES